MDPPIFTMKSVTNEKTEPEQARKRKTKTTVSLFSEKDQLMLEADKATFAQTCFKNKVDLLETNEGSKFYVIDRL